MDIADLKEHLLELVMLDIRYFCRGANANLSPQLQLHPEISQFLKDYPIGGVVLFKENLDTKEQIKELTNTLQISTKKYPRFIAVDEEGGVVSRIGIETMGNMALGVIDDTNITATNARIIAHELKSLGCNFNFAPVVDINSNPDNPIIGVRAFGADPLLVARHGVAFAKGMHSDGIIACAKHFPGHGDVNADSHLEVPYLNKSRIDLEGCELIPYKELIKNECLDAIMTAHIALPEIDQEKIQLRGNDAPKVATVSKIILQDILRQQLGFNGVIVTDALDMQAITANFSALEVSIESIKAGADILLMPIRIWDSSGIREFQNYFMALFQACLADEELMRRVNESYLRVIRLKQKYLKTNNMLGTGTINSTESAPEIKLYSRDIQLNLAKRAITLERNKSGYIPFTLDKNSKVLLICRSLQLLQTISSLMNEIGSHLPFKLDIDSIQLTHSIDMEENILDKILQYSHVITFTYNLPKRDQEFNQVFLLLNKLHKPYTNISCYNPYDIRFVPDATTNILLYGCLGFDQTSYKQTNFTLNLHAALDMLLQGEYFA